ncbi:MAG: hypothetical protein J6B08_02065 [Ruminiclostridium sp.]|nr:hypothetical protein [Ruminiclostridium sp.]
MSVINDLFNGEINAFESMRYDKISSEAEKEMSKYLEKADKKLPKEDGRRFSDLVREQVLTLETRASEQAFGIGFALGVRLASECFCYDKE